VLFKPFAEMVHRIRPQYHYGTSPLITGVRDAGLEGEKIYSAPEAKNRYIVRNGQPISLPGSPWEFVRTKLFSASAKIRLAGEPFIRRAKAEENLAAFVQRRLGQEFLDYAINPFVAGIFAGDPQRLSVRYAFPKLHALEQRYGSLILGQILGASERRRRGEVSKQNAKKFSFVSGLETLTDALGMKLGEKVHHHARVTAVERNRAGWAIASAREGETIEEQHQAVLFAAPAHKLAHIEVRSCPGVSLNFLKNLRFSPVATVALGFRREDVVHALDGLGYLVPEVERLHILGPSLPRRSSATVRPLARPSHQLRRWSSVPAARVGTSDQLWNLLWQTCAASSA
jgi:oxygen-dependent protoporphyrinogen oxidase